MLPSVHIFILIFILFRFKTSVLLKNDKYPSKMQIYTSIRCKIWFLKTTKKNSDVLILGRREGVQHDTKMSLFFMS